LQLESNHMREGDDVMFLNTPPGFLYQLGNLFTGIGPLAFLIGIFGLLYGLFKKVPWVLVVLPAFVAYYLIVGPSQVKFMRYGLPLVPAIAIGFGYAIGCGWHRPKWRGAAIAAGCISILGLESLAFSGFKPSPYWGCFDPRFGGLVGTVRYTQDMMAEDPLDTAARYVIGVSKTDPSATVGIFRIPWYWTVPVIKDASFLFNTPTKFNKIVTALYLQSTHDPTVQMVYSSPPPKYVVLTSFETDPFDRITNPSQVPDIWSDRYSDLKGVLDDIHKNYTVVKSFGGDAPAVPDLMYVQPKAWVLQRK